MLITDWPSEERPREKLLQFGADHLSDAELLAIILRIGLPGKNIIDLCRELLIHFGGLRGLLEADRKSLCKIPGLGLTKYVQLKAALALAERYLLAKMHRSNPLQNINNTKKYLMARMRHYQDEVFACLFLDHGHCVLGFEELSRGSVCYTTVCLRNIVRQCLHYNAAAVIFAHNHPSGIALPSDADSIVTEKLATILVEIDVAVLDHFIIGEQGIYSLAKRGCL